MKLSTANKIQGFTHKLLFFISLFLSGNLFIQFSNIFYAKIIFGGLATAFELIKYYILLKSKFNWGKGLKAIKTGGKGIAFSLILTSITQLFLVISFTGISTIASTGFALGEIKKKDAVITRSETNSDYEIETYNRKIKSVKKDIERREKEKKNYQDNIDRYQRDLQNAKFGTWKFRNLEAKKYDDEQNIKKINKLIEKKREELEKIQDALTEFKRVQLVEKRKITTTTTTDIFDDLGEPIGMAGKDVLLALLMFAVVFLEISLMATCGNIDPRIDKKIGLINRVKLIFKTALFGESVESKEENFVSIDRIQEESFINKLNDTYKKGLEKQTLHQKNEVIPKEKIVEEKKEEISKMPEEKIRKKVKNNIYNYTIALMDIEDGMKLNNNKIIFKKTGIPLEDCKKYKEQLLKLSHKGTPLIENKKGYMVANFSKANMLRLLKAFDRRNLLDIHKTQNGQ